MTTTIMLCNPASIHTNITCAACEQPFEHIGEEQILLVILKKHLCYAGVFVFLWELERKLKSQVQQNKF